MFRGKLEVIKDDVAVDESKIYNILARRLFRGSKESKKFFPPVFQNTNVIWIKYLTENYFLLAFVDIQNNERIKKLAESNYPPFPGLISDHDSVKAAFQFIDSRNILLSGNSVSNMFTISLGKDCSIVICNHNQKVQTVELGPYEYNLDLAYIISYGDKINQENIYEYLEDLIVYSISEWRSKNETNTST
jgi:hypothetical protein